MLHPRSSAHSERVLPKVAVPLDPYAEVVLPPTAYCPREQTKIPTQEKMTVERTIPYTDDEMEEFAQYETTDEVDESPDFTDKEAMMIIAGYGWI